MCWWSTPGTVTDSLPFHGDLLAGFLARRVFSVLYLLCLPTQVLVLTAEELKSRVALWPNAKLPVEGMGGGQPLHCTSELLPPSRKVNPQGSAKEGGGMGRTFLVGF